MEARRMNCNSTAVPAYRRISGLCLVLLFAVSVRIYFHPGNLDTMEFAAARPAIEIASGNLVPAGFPSYRYGLVYPVAVSFLAFGANLASLTLYNLVCSVGTLMLAYALASRMAGHSVGLEATFLLAVLPLDMELAGRALPDGPQAFFAALGLWLFLICPERAGKWRIATGLAGGVFFGISYLCKVTTFFLWPVLLVYALLRKEARVPCCLLLAGCCIVLAGEMLFNYELTGDPFARYHAIAGTGKGSGLPLGYSTSSPFIVPQNFFMMPIAYGLHMYVCVLAIVSLALRDCRKYMFLLLWFLWFVGYSWLGTTSLSAYRPLSQFERYLAIANVPLVVMSAAWLGGLQRRWRWLALAALGLAGLFMANLKLEENEDAWGIWAVSRELKTRADDYPVYANIRGNRTLGFFLGSDGNREVISYASTAKTKGMVESLTQLENAYVMVSYIGIRDVLARYPYEKYPPEIFSPPDNWTEVTVVDTPLPKSVYLQLRFVRWVAQLPFVPGVLSEKVMSNADETLQERDVVLYFVEPRDNRDRTGEE